MNMIQKRPLLFILISLIAGWAIGLFLFGWLLTPVQYSGAGPEHLLKQDQDLFLLTLADAYAADNDQSRVKAALRSWDDAPAAICSLKVASFASGKADRLENLAAALNNSGCAAVDAMTSSSDGSILSGRLRLYAIIASALVVLLLISFVISSWLNNRKPRRSTRPFVDAARDNNLLQSRRPEPAAQQVEDYPGELIPLAKYQSSYAIGMDMFDDAFSIENAQGEFLGECGVGISEVVGTGSPKRVTAVDVWLFDKADVKTVTTVLLSEFAFSHDELRAKLAPKGDPLLVATEEYFTLETSTLMLKAVVRSADYGRDSSVPPGSYFDRLTVELSAWAKQ